MSLWDQLNGGGSSGGSTGGSTGGNTGGGSTGGDTAVDTNFFAGSENPTNDLPYDYFYNATSGDVFEKKGDPGEAGP
ncbi:MAG: hypothetical protein AAGB04_19540 [Pseudomonadota bacterium]